LAFALSCEAPIFQSSERGQAITRGERRFPKPGVGGSNPLRDAKLLNILNSYIKLFLGLVDSLGLTGGLTGNPYSPRELSVGLPAAFVLAVTLPL
jgi:hypothetical protein